MTWLFHKAQWGDLVVSVMPRSTGNRVIDSNTGIVLEAPYHRAIRACAVVNNGRMSNCDARAINKILSGRENDDSWKHAPCHTWTLPTYRVREAEINDVWREAIESLSKSISKYEAEARLEMTLGWCTDSVTCWECGLTIPGHFPTHVAAQARDFGWGMGENGLVTCPAHAIVKPFPSDEEIEAMERA